MKIGKAHVRVVREWCVSLGILTQVSISRQEAEMKLAAYIPLLLQRFPDAAFTAESLEHVAAHAIKGFPTYAELAQWLSEWWNPRRPLPPALPPPVREPVAAALATDAERAHVRALVKDMTARVRANANADETVAGGSYGARYLSPGVLDQINPLPNGRKRSEAAS